VIRQKFITVSKISAASAAAAILAVIFTVSTVHGTSAVPHHAVAPADPNDEQPGGM
jgi:hypothetical protein